ncbi:ABC transporter permease [Salinibius halmophilus]|uniref:ABC transporter permease n=1 Tax=Salinibius halmophilus TaxID=1853216 RepID=UPI000E669090|nr:ABC transporter permease [Salinibius halmophilus]
MTSSNKTSLALMLWVPLLVFSSLLAIMSSERPVDTRLAVIDLDQSPSSRLLVRQLDASQRLQTITYAQSPERSLASGDIAGILTIPSGYEQSLSNRQPLAIHAKLNMANYLQANQVHSQLLQQTITDAVRQQAKQFLTNGSAIQQATWLANPVAMVWQRQNNPELSYRQALLPGFLLQAWNLCFSLLIVWLMADTQPRRACPKAAVAFIGYLTWLWCLQAVCSWLAGRTPDLATMLAGALNLLAMTGIALFMLGLTGNRRLALNGMSVVAATALAFMGVSFPFDSMPLTAQLWANLLPITSVYRVWLGQDATAMVILLLQASGWLVAGVYLWQFKVRAQHG